MKQLYIKSRAEWRDWLSGKHDKESEVWLVFFRKGTRRVSIDYDASVEEALCFGWIDSIIKKLDETRYARKYTPRKDNSRWSALNKKRVEKMKKKGQMTEFGEQKIKAAKRLGNWNNITMPQLSFKMDAEFEDALGRNPKARIYFESLAQTYQKQYMGWIEVAKRPETKKKRIKESIFLLEKGEKLGLK